MNTRWLLALLSAVVPMAALAQAPPAAERPEEVHTLPPVKAELVEIDAVVTDRKGEPVRGLRPEDFEVREDGKRQRITYFKDGRGRPVPVLADAPALPAAETPASAPEDWQGRYIVLAVDDLNMEPASFAQAKRAFRRFAEEQVGEDDLVAVVTTSGSLGHYQPFTRPGIALARAIDRLAPRPRMDTSAGFLHMSEYQAELIERGDRDALRLAVQEILESQPGSQYSFAASEAESTARRIVAETVHRARATLGTIEDVVRSLAPLEGRKVMILASDGFLVGLGTRSSQAFDLRDIVDAATRSGVVIYGVDTRGLVALVPGGDASSRSTPVMSAPGVRESIEHQSMQALRDAMHTLADDTGGFLVAGTNDLASGFKRIVVDNDAYYVLAYEPTNGERNGKFRKIQVRLPGRRGLRVRTRKGYFAPDDRNAPSVAALRAEAAATQAARREADLHRGLSSLFPLRELPVGLSADFLRRPPMGSQVVVSALIDLAKARFEAAGDRQKAVLEVVAMIYDEKGEVAENLQAERVTLSLGAERHQLALQEGLRYQKSAALKPGLYQVRVVVREEGTGRLGSASEWVEVPEVAAGKLALSSLFLSAGPAETITPAAASAERPPVREVQALKRFRRSEALSFQLYVYEPARDGAGATDVVLQAQVWAGPRQMAASPVGPVIFEDEGGGPIPYTSSFPLGSFAPGSYELRVAVSDRKSGQSQVRRVTFLLE
jgi:VWFA-related protein